MTTTDSGQNARARNHRRYQVATVLLFAVSLLTAVAWTGQAWGQDKLARVGYLSFASVTDDPREKYWSDLFRHTLGAQGWIEGKTVSIEYRSAHSDPSQLAEAAVALVDLEVDVIFAASAPALRAAYAATRTIPIVASDYTTDPIEEGYVNSYSRPGGNVTGVFLDAPEIAGKWFELLTSMIPDLSRTVVLWDPGPGTVHLNAVRTVAASLNIQLQVFEVRKPEDIDRAFDALRGQPQAAMFLPSPMIHSQSPRLAKLALKYRLAATSMAVEFANAGGAITYGPEEVSANDRAAVLVGKILGGTNPAEIPVERPQTIQLVVNLNTIKALGLTIPSAILVRADRVIR